MLDLAYAAGPDRTRLVGRRHSGPLLVQRPFYPEPGGVCHTYVLHPPSGIVGGDELRLTATLAPGTAALITTPGATRCYRSRGPTARIAQSLRVDDGAALEWLPQETLLFDGARVTMRTRVDLAPAARFIGWDIACLGRPACGERYALGTLDLGFELHRAGRPLLLERLRLGEAPGAVGAPALRGHTVSGCLLATGADPTLLDRVRGTLEASGALAGATLLDDVLVCRVLAPGAREARALFEAVWALARTALLGRPPCAPRIWRT